MVYIEGWLACFFLSFWSDLMKDSQLEFSIKQKSF